MTTTDVLIVSATLISPFLAVYAQKKIERWRNVRDTKLSIFKTLMATRGATLSPQHVEALNMIDLEFSDSNRGEAKVKRAWREYLDHLGNLPTEPAARDAALAAWNIRNGEYLAELLVAMGDLLGYKFDRVYIKKSCYAPEGHSRDEATLRALRAEALRLLRGELSIPTRTTLVPADKAAAEFSQRLQAGLVGVLEGTKQVSVKTAKE